jgi:hypothetical protein
MQGFSIFKILLLTVLDFFVGMLWHSEYLFKKAWLKAMGISKEQMMAARPDLGKLFSIQMVLNLIYVLVHAYLLNVIAPATLCDSLCTSFLLWLGFTANAQFSPILWEGKPFTLFIINGGFRLTNTLLFSFLYYYL